MKHLRNPCDITLPVDPFLTELRDAAPRGFQIHDSRLKWVDTGWTVDDLTDTGERGE